MEKRLNKIEEEALREIEAAKSGEELEAIRTRYMGRKGYFTEFLKSMKDLPQDQRPVLGAKANALKAKLTKLFESKIKTFGKKEGILESSVDITMPGAEDMRLGHKHPITKIISRINEIFIGLGFKIAEGPEIETEYYNFEALNIPLEHPSRDVFDTFYIKRPMLLRSQTSTVQIRVMENEKPPLQVIAPGKVYRPDAVDASHSFMFHQVEGFMVDKEIKFSDLKGTLSLFARQMFGEDAKIRFRPHFFPFTEPSAEVDVSCIMCGGKGCRVCSYKGWLEILGAGMINPKVFEAVGYNPEKWTGYAFGMGVERIAMLKYGINDIRLFFENDLRFLRQF
ncbi:MAG: phenylalanine--tRNA ligase subunit alpha [Candidatus Omnitrophica bacterium]|nr:phenylalanine--tRNA ligase subunit alpha [Candidatus Omnitrophota bacterium]